MKIEGRTLVTVRCRARRHVLARVIARAEDGHRVLEVPRWAVVDKDARGSGSVLRNNLGGGVVDLDDERDETRLDGRHVSCACGHDFHLFAGDMLPSQRMEARDGIRYRVEGETVPAPSEIILDPAPTRR